MNHLYLKRQFYCSIIVILIFHAGIASAQRAASKHGDRYDLVANINKLQTDQRKIENLKYQISVSKEAKDKKDLKVHREKLKLEKKNLKKDYQHAKEQESSYKKNKAERIKLLEAEMKASNERYEAIRMQIKKNLAKKNDFALQKDAAQLLEAVQDKNDASTKLSMEKSDLITTVGAMDDAWKKMRQQKNDPPIQKVNPEPNLTKK